MTRIHIALTGLLVALAAPAFAAGEAGSELAASPVTATLQHRRPSPPVPLSRMRERGWRAGGEPGVRAAPTRSAPIVRITAAPHDTTPDFDRLIRNGWVIDGTGSPGFRADVGIRGDRIAALGRLPGYTARDTIDASGLVVAPGFIDMLGHSEYRLLRDGRAISKITQGITSEVTGEVFSVAPMNPKTLDGVERDFRPLVDWTDLNGYFRTLERRGTAINLGTFVTVGTVRRAVMGDASRAPSAAELERMRQLVAETMRQGAIGLSVGLAYTPASHATEAELTALARAAAENGGGYASHIRSEGAGLLSAVAEAIRIGERSGAWVQIHHLKASGKPNWGRVAEAVRLIDAARARGIDVTADVYPYTAAGTGLDAVLPDWVQAGGADSLLARLRDPATRARIRAELTAGGTDLSIGASAGGPSGVLVSDVLEDSLARYEGMRLTEIAAARKQPVVDALLDLLVADNASSSAVYFAMDESDVRTALRQPWAMIGIDAGARAADSTLREKPHPRAFGAFPRILCRYVRQQGMLTLEDAIRKFTALPAARSGLDERGVLKAGLYADITIFDPVTVCDRATYADPVQISTGIRHVLVNGVPVLRNGTPTGARPGRGLRGPGRAVEAAAGAPPAP